MNTEATSWDALSGAYQLCPGRQRSVVGQRPVLGDGRLAGLLRGQKSEQVAQTLTSVFTLCAHAHRRTADLAFAAAQGKATGAQQADPAVLLLETARDHLRTLALDWPRRVWAPAPRAPDMSWLRDCPLSLASSRPPGAAQAMDAIGGLRDWLERLVLGEPAMQWLDRHGQPDSLADWCAAQSSRLAPARCLAAWHPTAHPMTPASRCLDLLDDEPRQAGQLRLLGEQIAADPEFVQQPTWRGQAAENGPWARLRHQRAGAALTASIWTRLTSRWLELVQIAASDQRTSDFAGAPLLASGALALGGGKALGWCEMARGLLIHWVRVDAQGAVQDYRVLAPTEWNFHPAGTLALSVAQLDPADVAGASTLAAAFDPCVACSVVAAT